VNSRAVLVAALLSASPAWAIDSVRMVIAADAGGGLDTTARTLGKAMVASGSVKNVQYENRPGAAGAIALAQFVNSSRGDPGALLVGGAALAVSVIQNQSAVTLSQVTPVARLVWEPKVAVAVRTGAELANWHGVFAAPAITAAQRDELVKAVEVATRSREWQESLKPGDRVAGWLGGDGYATFLEAENKRINDIFGPAGPGRK
jgi:tripartite-type tricarboxylate transporter receptor subunit TctC